MVEITKFGTITENDEGGLVFENFNMEYEDMSVGEAILTAVIRRLILELAKLKAHR